MDGRHGDGVLLVVDDDAAIRETVGRFLEMEFGLPVARAENGSRALQLLGTELPLLVLTDVRMPVLGGVELIRQLRTNPATRQVPIITMAATIARRDEALAAGADSYLDKPFDLGTLAAKVRACLARRGSIPAGPDETRLDPPDGSSSATVD